MDDATRQDMLEEDKYAGMFAGNRIGGMPTVKLNIIGEELSMLERGCRPLPAGRLAPGPLVKSPHTRAVKDAAELRATLRRPGTSMGFVGRMRGTVSKEAAFRRSGLDTEASERRMFGTEHGTSARDRFSTSYKEQFKFYEGADEISLYTTMRKKKARQEAPRSSTSLGLRHVETAQRRQPAERFRSKRCNPFDNCPMWETTTSGNFKASNWDKRESCYRRIKPAVQQMNPLVPSDI